MIFQQKPDASRVRLAHMKGSTAKDPEETIQKLPGEIGSKIRQMKAEHKVQTGPAKNYNPGSPLNKTLDFVAENAIEPLSKVAEKAAQKAEPMMKAGMKAVSGIFNKKPNRSPEDSFMPMQNQMVAEQMEEVGLKHAPLIQDKNGKLVRGNGMGIRPLTQDKSGKTTAGPERSVSVTTVSATPAAVTGLNSANDAIRNEIKSKLNGGQTNGTGIFAKTRRPAPPATKAELEQKTLAARRGIFNKK